MLSFVIRKIPTGLWQNHPFARRSSTISLRPQSQFTFVISGPTLTVNAPVRYTKALDNIKALRKEGVADLKAETERLESLSREKAHADKLKDRITEMNNNIAARTAEYEELKAAYDQQVRSNQILNDTGSKFREIYAR